MSLRLPDLYTERLSIRALTMDDLDAVHRLLDTEISHDLLHTEPMPSIEDRRSWLQWTIASYTEFARLYQPPYGERAIVLRQTQQLIGAVGFVPCLNAFGVLPSLRLPRDARAGLNSTELGLFWAVFPAFQRQGYATEAAGAMVEFSFRHLRLHRIVATTDHENTASRRVMEKLGMRIETNPFPDPPWLQVVGILDNQGNTKAQPALGGISDAR